MTPEAVPRVFWGMWTVTGGDKNVKKRLHSLCHQNPDLASQRSCKVNTQLHKHLSFQIFHKTEKDVPGPEMGSHQLPQT